MARQSLSSQTAPGNYKYGNLSMDKYASLSLYFTGDMSMTVFSFLRTPLMLVYFLTF